MKDLIHFREFIKSLNFQLKNVLGYHLEYFWPVHRGEQWERFERVLKIGWDSHDHSKVDLIYTDHQYISRPDAGIETITRYLDSSGPMSFPTHEKALHFLDRMDFEKYMELEWKIQIFKCHDIELSIALAGGEWTAKLTGTIDAAKEFLQMVEPYTGFISPLQEPLENFMYRSQRRRAEA